MRSSRRGWRTAASISQSFIARARSPKNGDTYLVETSTYLVGAAGDPLTSRPTVPFSALHNLPLVLFCRPSSWRNHLEQIGAERGISLNVALEADSLSLQTHIVAEGGIYALLGPYAIAAASKECRLQSSKLVDPVVTRHIALAMSRHGEPDTRLPDRDAGRARDREIRRGGAASPENCELAAPCRPPTAGSRGLWPTSARRGADILYKPKSPAYRYFAPVFRETPKFSGSCGRQ